MERNRPVYRLMVSALLVALGLVLPFLTGQLPALGQAICPLHIPALLAGLTCGWGWGTAVGAVLPLLRSLLFGMPVMIPTAVSMAVELASYGLITGLLYPRLCQGMKHMPAMLLALLAAMVVGRVLGGGAKAVTMGLTGGTFSFAMFISGYFTATGAGALIHLLVIPPVVLALEKAHLSPGA